MTPASPGVRRFCDTSHSSHCRAPTTLSKGPVPHFLAHCSIFAGALVVPPVSRYGQVGLIIRQFIQIHNPYIRKFPPEQFQLPLVEPAGTRVAHVLDARIACLCSTGGTMNMSGRQRLLTNCNIGEFLLYRRKETSERPHMIFKIGVIVAACLAFGKYAIFQQIPYARIQYQQCCIGRACVSSR